MKKTVFTKKSLCSLSVAVIALIITGALSVTGCLEIVKEIPITCELSASAFHFPFEGGEQSLTVNSNTIEWHVTGDASWITVTPSKGAKKATVTVRAAANTEPADRSAMLTVTGTGILTPLTVPVSMSAAPVLTVTPDALSFAATDTPKQLTVASNTNWTVGKNADWLTVTPMSGTNAGTLSVTATANTGTEQRTGSVSVSSPGLTPRNVSVTQSGVNPTLQVSPNAMSFTADDTPKTFSVSSNISWTVNYGSASWLTVAPMSGSGNGTVTVTPSANTNTAGRNVDLTVSGAGVSSQTVSVSQSGTAPPIIIDMVQALGDTYTMGCTSDVGSYSVCEDDERPAHSVTLTTFYIGKYEVTQGQWRAVMGNNPSEFQKGDNYPVERVTWYDIVGRTGATMVINNITYYADGFIYKLNQLTGKQYRLPTEAEWEFAARGGRSRRGYSVSGSENEDDVAWHGSNSSGSTHPVGTKAANELGIHDMSGNVYEWCSDWYSSSYYRSSPQNNPQGPSSGSERVVRGGSWLGTWAASAWFVRVSNRDGVAPSTRSYYGDGIGFRLASSSN